MDSVSYTVTMEKSELMTMSPDRLYALKTAEAREFWGIEEEDPELKVSYHFEEKLAEPNVVQVTVTFYR